MEIHLERKGSRDVALFYLIRLTPKGIKRFIFLRFYT
tara:strand:+ start:477 stop:587 length:111 start_codon:yes stop_codon:yes gene_type:complete